jgi:hypothetical protein
MKSHSLMRDFGYTIVALALLAGLYVGSYYGSVSAEEVDGVDLDPVTLRPRRFCQLVVAKYSFEQTIGPERSRAFFSPIHELDRKLRPSVWYGADIDATHARLAAPPLSWTHGMPTILLDLQEKVPLEPADPVEPVPTPE